MHAGLGDESSAGRDLTFVVADRILVEPRLGEIPMQAREALEAEFVGAMGAVAHTRFLHDQPPHTPPAPRGGPGVP